MNSVKIKFLFISFSIITPKADHKICNKLFLCLGLFNKQRKCSKEISGCSKNRNKTL